MTTAVVLTHMLGSEAIENHVFVYESYASQVFVDDVRLKKPPSERIKRSRIKARGEWYFGVFIGSLS